MCIKMTRHATTSLAFVLSSAILAVASDATLPYSDMDVLQVMQQMEKTIPGATKLKTDDAVTIELWKLSREEQAYTPKGVLDACGIEVKRLPAVKAWFSESTSYYTWRLSRSYWITIATGGNMSLPLEDPESINRGFAMSIQLHKQIGRGSGRIGKQKQ